MNRRQFLLRAGGLLVVLPSARALAQVKGRMRGGSGILTYTSTVTGEHDHTITLGRAALARAPATGLSGNTSESGHHRHAVLLSKPDITQLLAGGTVIAQTTTVVGHHHDFVFRLPKATKG